MNSVTQTALDVAKRVLEPQTRRRMKFRYVGLRRHIPGIGAVPDFLVIGAQRAGTTSLYRYLDYHPATRSSIRKEVEYFTRHYDEEPFDWYRAHFPTRRRSDWHIYEATPDYLFVPGTAGRVRHGLPEAKFIVLLRDPVERAYSHYKHMVRLGFETHDFETAIELEDERIGRLHDECRRDPSRLAPALRHFSYVRRGLYGDQLEDWTAHFPTDRFCVVFSEHLFADPQRALERIARFLELPPPHDFGDTTRNHSYTASDPAEHRSSGIPSALRPTLRARFEESNEKLRHRLTSTGLAPILPGWLASPSG